MHWTINYFTFQQCEWHMWQSTYPDMMLGHLAYAEHQKAMWEEIRAQAGLLFKNMCCLQFLFVRHYLTYIYMYNMLNKVVKDR